MIASENFNSDAQLSKVSEMSEDLIEQFIRFILMGEADTIDIAKVIIKIPAAVNDYVFIRKINRFWNGMTNNGTNKLQLVQFSSALFDDDLENNKKAAYRLIQEINKAETDEILQYIINASHALGNGLIDKMCYFRIVWVLCNSLTEDLLYFASIATNNGMIPGNIHIFSLVQNGIMLQAEIDSNKGVEDQSYIVTEFGKRFDRYALSYEDEEREKYWKNAYKNDGVIMKFKTDAPRFKYFKGDEKVTVNIHD